jgi:hypothetical protein
MLVKEAELFVGGLSNPSKMPGFSYNIPASKCKVGSKLRKVEGSVCERCYAMKGRYTFPKVQDALHRRLKSINRKGWVESMIVLITHKSRQKQTEYFRWHDSGDIQNTKHLGKICAVCEGTPHIRHWLPTREYQIVKEYFKTNPKPENLVVRLSAHMIGKEPSKKALHPTSSVSKKGQVMEGAFNCPARTQGNSCGDCRACWDSNVQHVSYTQH